MLSARPGSRKMVVADLGCGDAALAQHFQNRKNVKVQSFDLVKVNEFVDVCDIANVPLAALPDGPEVRSLFARIVAFARTELLELHSDRSRQSARSGFLQDAHAAVVMRIRA